MTLDDLRKLEKLATPGPWEPRRVNSQRWDIDAPNGDGRLHYSSWDGVARTYGSDDNKQIGGPIASDNAALIAALRNAAPALIACAEALRMVTQRYVSLINSGDCGNWNPEDEGEVIAAREALRRLEQLT